MEMFLNAFLLGALVNVGASTLQFLTISVLKIAPLHAWFDPIRSVSEVSIPRFGMYRSVGLFGDPNDVGMVMVCALAIMLPRTIKSGKRRHRILWGGLCLLTIFAIIGTLSIFAILPALLVILIFFSLSINNRIIKNFLIVTNIACLLIISLSILRSDTLFSWLGYGYTGEQVFNSFSYLPQAFEEGNIFGRGYGISSDLADRFGAPLGSTADRQTYWFYLDQITVQIGLIGVVVWLSLWAMFLYQGYLNINIVNQKKSVEYRLTLSIFLCLLGLFLSSLHYGPWRPGGVDLLMYLLWAFVSTSRPVLKTVLFPRKDYDKIKAFA
ncbi:hypothetical protein [Desulfobacula sp.]|uniref:hypothetical protein n=1 Tax=Desulfobacula sp. TaxID=2593537 RepID=UPI00271544D5|nr:hypothetical protein [Desulfobacula sp.]